MRYFEFNKKDKTGWSACGEPVWTFGFQGPEKRWQAVIPTNVARGSAWSVYEGFSHLGSLGLIPPRNPLSGVVGGGRPYLMPFASTRA